MFVCLTNRLGHASTLIRFVGQKLKSLGASYLKALAMMNTMLESWDSE